MIGLSSHYGFKCLFWCLHLRKVLFSNLIDCNPTWLCLVCFSVFFLVEEENESASLCSACSAVKFIAISTTLSLLFIFVYISHSFLFFILYLQCSSTTEMPIFSLWVPLLNLTQKSRVLICIKKGELYRFVCWCCWFFSILSFLWGKNRKGAINQFSFCTSISSMGHYRIRLYVSDLFT